MDANDCIKQANEERFTVAQIEDPEPLAELVIAGLRSRDEGGREVFPSEIDV